MMKKRILLPLFSLLLITMASCGSGSTENPDANAYQCPMQCEGDKTYDKPGDCPVCGMELSGTHVHQ